MELKNEDKMKAVSELRRDPVTGNWIVVAKERGKRPVVSAAAEAEDPIETCPFEDPQASGNKAPVLIYQDKNDWFLQVIPNKYPAFSGTGCPQISRIGPYFAQEGLGFHEVIITRDHYKHLALLSSKDAEEVLGAYRERYNILKKEECVKYISIFHNHGQGAGASLTHPHSQLIAIPILPSNIRRSLIGSDSFYKRHGTCVHCRMLAFEIEDKKRVILENAYFIAICPFISRRAYEVRIYPKEHSAHFEDLGDRYVAQLAGIFHEALGKIYKNLDNAPYNFYLHTAPIGGRKYRGYHWHFEIQPRIEEWAGFELGTGIEISTIEPERSAEILRK